jgi:large subunit ribosomal protein L32
LIDGGIGKFLRKIASLIPQSLFPASLLFAVPKKRVTHSRKRKRMATKWPRNVWDIEQCPGCGSMKKMHNLCWKCYIRFKIEVKLKTMSNSKIDGTRLDKQ